MRSVTGLPDNDRDSDTVSGHGAHGFSPDGERSQAETITALRECTARLVARFGLHEHSAKRCRCGINLERARCCQCQPMTRTELGR